MVLRAWHSVQTTLPVAGFCVHDLDDFAVRDFLPDEGSRIACEKVPVLEVNERSLVGLAFVVLPDNQVDLFDRVDRAPIGQCFFSSAQKHFSEYFPDVLIGYPRIDTRDTD